MKLERGYTGEIFRYYINLKVTEMSEAKIDSIIGSLQSQGGVYL
jgi:hypothetical protein